MWGIRGAGIRHYLAAFRANDAKGADETETDADSAADHDAAADHDSAAHNDTQAAMGDGAHGALDDEGHGDR